MFEDFFIVAACVVARNFYGGSGGARETGDAPPKPKISKKFFCTYTSTHIYMYGGMWSEFEFLQNFDFFIITCSICLLIVNNTLNSLYAYPLRKRKNSIPTRGAIFRRPLLHSLPLVPQNGHGKISPLVGICTNIEDLHININLHTKQFM